LQNSNDNIRDDVPFRPLGLRQPLFAKANGKGSLLIA
jgi:hypothetical protein